MITVETHSTLSAAATALGPDAVYLGGGTLVMRALNYAEGDFTRIVRTTDETTRRIASSGERIEIGAGVTMRQIIDDRATGFLAPVARAVGGPAIRNMATVGGNLFAEHPYGDFTVALLALDGRVRMASGEEHPLDVFLGNRDRAGLVAAVTIANPRDGEFRWRKVSRVKPKGVSVMSIAAWLPGAGIGRVNEARVAFGAMAETPKRAAGVEHALEGRSLDAAGIAPALEAVRGDFAPPDDALASGWYRSEVAPVHLRRLLLGEEAR